MSETTTETCLPSPGLLTGRSTVVARAPYQPEAPFDSHVLRKPCSTKWTIRQALQVCDPWPRCFELEPQPQWGGVLALRSTSDPC